MKTYITLLILASKLELVINITIIRRRLNTEVHASLVMRDWYKERVAISATAPSALFYCCSPILLKPHVTFWIHVRAPEHFGVVNKIGGDNEPDGPDLSSAVLEIIAGSGASFALT